MSAASPGRSASTSSTPLRVVDDEATPNRAARRKRKRKPELPTEPRPNALAYNARETAYVLGCSTSLVWLLLKNGSLHGFNLGSRRLISKAELDEFMAAGGTESSERVYVRPEPPMAGDDDG